MKLFCLALLSSLPLVTAAEASSPAETAGLGESCQLYGTQCAEGLVCEYQCPGGETGDCNLGINPHGTCVSAPAPEASSPAETAGLGESCQLYGTQCAEGLVCEYQCPGGETGDCNLGINPHGTCVTAPADAGEAQTCEAEPVPDSACEGLTCGERCCPPSDPECSGPAIFECGPQGTCAFWGFGGPPCA
jgi:hypothetical protein